MACCRRPVALTPLDTDSKIAWPSWPWLFMKWSPSDLTAGRRKAACIASEHRSQSLDVPSGSVSRHFMLLPSSKPLRGAGRTLDADNGTVVRVAISALLAPVREEMQARKSVCAVCPLVLQRPSRALVRILWSRSWLEPGNRQFGLPSRPRGARGHVGSRTSITFFV